MKKILSLLLALIMVFSLATVAFADGNEVEEDPAKTNDYSANLDKGTTFTKEYKVNNGEAPAEDFEFEVEYKSFKDQNGTATTADSHPTVTLGKASFGAKEASGTSYTATASVTITNYAECALGVYTYEITEKAGTNAGVSYEAKPVYVVVTVLRDEQNQSHYVAAIHYETEGGDKTTQTTNQYDAGSLTITKEITGNMADMDKEFSFTITFTAPDDLIINSNITYISGNNVLPVQWNPMANSSSIKSSIGNDESIVITNIPAGVTYTITEDKENYTQTRVEGESVEDGTVSGTIEANDKDTAKYTNDLSSNVDTGIALDSAPYFLMLAVAVVGMVALVSKKRYEV